MHKIKKKIYTFHLHCDMPNKLSIFYFELTIAFVSFAWHCHAKLCIKGKFCVSDIFIDFMLIFLWQWPTHSVSIRWYLEIRCQVKWNFTLLFLNNSFLEARWPYSVDVVGKMLAIDANGMSELKDLLLMRNRLFNDLSHSLSVCEMRYNFWQRTFQW